MKKIFLTILLFTLTLSSFATIYYFKGAPANALQNTSSWSTDSTGVLNIAPANFLSTADVFVVQKGNPADGNKIFLTLDWDVKGTIVVGNTLGGEVRLNIGQFNFKAATLNIVDNADSRTDIGFQNRLVFNGDNSTYFNVNFGTLSSNSLVNYNGDFTHVIKAANYGNLQIGGGATARTVYFDSSTLGVAKIFSITGTNITFDVNDNNKIIFNGTTNQNITLFNYKGLEVTGNTTRTVSFPAGTIGVGSNLNIPATNVTYIVDNNNIVNYNSANWTQTVTLFPYKTLQISSPNNTTFNDGGNSSTYNLENLNILSSNMVDTKWALINISGAFTVSGTPTFNINGTFDFNGSGAQTVPSLKGSNAYNHLTFSGLGVKTLATGVNVNGVFSMQGLALGGSSVAPIYGVGSTLEYKTASTLTAGVEWVSPFLATGGVIIDGNSSAVVSLNANKTIGTNTNVPLTIKSTGRLNTTSSNFALTFHGSFIREAGSVFTANASPITVTGSQFSTVNIAGFTTTGLISFTKTDYRAKTNLLGRLPESGIGTFNILVNNNYSGSDDNQNELNFRSGISSFNTSGDLTVTKGRLFLHQAVVDDELNSSTNQQINQCGNLIMNASTSDISYCSKRVNQNLSSILKVTGNFTKTGGRLQTNGVTSLNGNFQFSGVNGTNHDVITDNNSGLFNGTTDNGQLYQTTFQVMAGNTVTFKSNFTINKGYSGWEGFVVENGGTLDFGQLATSPFTPYKIIGGITFEAKEGSTLIIRDPDGIYSGRDYNASPVEAQSNPLGNLGVVQTLIPYVSQIQTSAGVFTANAVGTFKRRFYSSAANYIFAGVGNQKTGIFQTSVNNGDNDLFTVNNLTINKSASANVVTGLQNFAVTNICNIAKGIFQIGESTPSNVSQTLTLNGTLIGINATDCLRSNTLCDMVINGSGPLGSSIFWDQSNIGKSRGADANGSLGNLTPGVTNNIRNFTLNRTGQTITLANEMQVNNTLTPTAGTLASGGNLVMLSTDATTSSILALGSGASITGNVVVQSFFKGGTVAANRGYRMIASPTANTTTFFPQIKERFIVTCDGGPAVGCDFRPIKHPNAQTLTHYIEPGLPGATSFFNINHLNTMQIGRGYYFFFRGSRAILNETTPGKINEPFVVPENWTAAYTGAINSGDITVPVTKTTTADVANDGLNLVGNPYPAVLNFTSFRNDASNTGIIDDYYMIMKRDRSGFFSYAGGIQSGSLTLTESAGATPGTAKDPFIQPGQAFFVRKKNPVGTANVTFKESHKAAAANSKNALRTLDKTVSSYPAVRQLIRFNIQNNETQDDATIVLEEGNSANWGGNDAPYMANNTIYIYSLTADGIPCAINFMPAVSDVKEIKLFVEATKSDSNLKLHFTELVGAGKNEVWLKDNYTATNTLISENNNTYTFGIDKSIKATSGKDRFVLFFVPKIIYEINLSNFTAKPNNIGVQLNWETLSEYNASKFELQRSADGVTFETIHTQATKAGGGNSNETLTYSYVDKTAQIGTIYYRIKMMFKNETTSISDVLTVNFNLDITNTLLVYPSLVQEELNMRWKIQNTGKFNLEIYDVTGKMVLSYKNLKGQSYTTNVSHLNSGVYILKVKDQITNQLTAVRKFIKY